MKKIIILTIVFFALSNCEIKPRTANAQSEATYNYHTETRDGMKYGVWQVNANSSQTGYNTFVVNLTKEELEIELIKLQIAEAHKRLNQ